MTFAAISSTVLASVSTVELIAWFSESCMFSITITMTFQMTSKSKALEARVGTSSDLMLRRVGAAMTMWPMLYLGDGRRANRVLPRRSRRRKWRMARPTWHVRRRKVWRRQVRGRCTMWQNARWWDVGCLSPMKPVRKRLHMGHERHVRDMRIVWLVGVFVADILRFGRPKVILVGWVVDEFP